ncbi:DUF2384 domain-containing protein [Pseudomonadaceae bacterium Sa2CUA2]|uniref:DUF2384 domain-containing protein n=2 Tax=Serpens gallinarum TaxID=2763075 RepID=A0ABR8TM33_9PSED|nr:DUF2384 domain-containing protein [Serpens gallinarum]
MKNSDAPDHANAKQFAKIEALAVQMFEEPARAEWWLSSSNIALAGRSPRSICTDEHGATLVKRLLHAIEFGGVV